MRQNRIFPALALGGGCAAFLLRLAQNRTGFEPDTGLPIPGNVWAVLLPLLLAALTAATALLLRRVPWADPVSASFADAFHTPDAGPVTLLNCGVGAMLLSGALELLRFPLYTSVLQGGASVSGLRALLIGNPLLAPRASLILGVLGVLSALALSPAMQTCRRRPRLQSSAVFNGTVLLIPPVYLVLRVVFVYRAESMSPTLTAYYVELLALTFLTLAFFRMSGFAFRAARTKLYLLWAVLAVVCSMAALADAPGLSGGFLYAGGALSQLAFLWMRSGTLFRS